VTDVVAEVLVLTNERDYAADLVIERLHQRGVAVRRLNTEMLTTSAPTWDPGSDDAASAVVWWRQLLPEPVPADSVTQLDEAIVVANQWRTYLSIFDRPGTRWVNPLWAARAAEDKVRQLRLATRIGFAVPPTIVTNSKQRAAEFRGAHGQCILKTLRAGYFAHSDQAFMFTRSLTDEVLELVDEWTEQPVIVQRQISPRTDVRCFVVGDTLVAAAAAQPPDENDDWRTVAGGTEWAPFALDPTIAERCVSYTHALGLAYCALDFVADDETLWFLEGNQAGEFAFIDRPLGLGIADALAGVLAGES
jgi:glutathione synthase/RimK-type ligase-like ATP-grasp enzyme